jgi:hypothetical protein
LRRAAVIKDALHTRVPCPSRWTDYARHPLPPR